MIVVWYTQCAAYSTICLLACSKNSRLPKLLKLLSDTELSLTTSHQVKSEVRLFMVVFAALVLVNIALLCYLIFSEDSSSVTSFTDILFSPVGNHIAVKVLLIPVHLLCFGAWFLPLSLYCLICSIIELQLEAIKEILETNISLQSDLVHYLEDGRRNHVQISDIVECIDAIYCGYTAISYSTNVPLGCFVLYMIIWPEQGNVIYLTLFSSFILLMALFYVFAVSHKAASIVAKVNKKYCFYGKLNFSVAT